MPRLPLLVLALADAVLIGLVLSYQPAPVRFPDIPVSAPNPPPALETPSWSSCRGN